MTMTPDLAQVVVDILQAHLAEINTAIPGRVLSYDASIRNASVQPMIKRRYKDGEVVSRPVIRDVPVIFPSAGGGTITFPIKKGDTVMLIFSQRSIDRWVRSTGAEEIDPQDNRKHDISDAVAIPGLFAFQSDDDSLPADPSNVKIGFGGASISITPNGAVNIQAPGGLTVNGDSQFNGDQAIDGDQSIDGDSTATGTVTGDTDVIAAGISGKSHTHPDPQGGVTDPPT